MLLAIYETKEDQKAAKNTVQWLILLQGHAQNIGSVERAISCRPH